MTRMKGRQDWYYYRHTNIMPISSDSIVTPSVVYASRSRPFRLCYRVRFPCTPLGPVFVLNMLPLFHMYPQQRASHTYMHPVIYYRSTYTRFYTSNRPCYVIADDAEEVRKYLGLSVFQRGAVRDKRRPTEHSAQQKTENTPTYLFRSGIVQHVMKRKQSRHRRCFGSSEQHKHRRCFARSDYLYSLYTPRYWPKLVVLLIIRRRDFINTSFSASKRLRSVLISLGIVSWGWRVEVHIPWAAARGKTT